MIDNISKMNRTKLAIIGTMIAMAASVLLTQIVMKVFHRPEVGFAFAMSAFIPMVTAFPIFWYSIGLLQTIYRLEKESKRLATFDILTGLMSRQAWLRSSRNLYKLSIRNNDIASIAYIDIDNFKRINDTYGHSGGDEVLKQFGALLRKLSRESDLIGRIGGEEFVILLPQTHLRGAVHMLNRIRLATQNMETVYSGTTIHFTISIGLSRYAPENPVDFEKLIQQADHALYKAKNSGKNSIAICNSNKRTDSYLVTATH